MTWTDQSAHHMYMPRPSTGRLLPAGNLLAQASIKGALARICCCPVFILGSEDAEHMRQLLYVVKKKATALKRTENFINAMDETVVSWYTDCRSLSDHLTNVNAAAVSDKRLAIDLMSLRQELWRERGNLVGNPTYSDELPTDRTTLCSWVATKTMPAHSLTKGVKSPQMDELMKTGWLQMMLQQPSIDS